MTFGRTDVRGDGISLQELTRHIFPDLGNDSYAILVDPNGSMKDSAIMDDIFTTSVGPRRFHVQVREGDGTARHYHVTVPENFIAELQLPEKDLDKVVRESFVFLLEREPASSIMHDFSLDVISSYFPEYKETLLSKL